MEPDYSMSTFHLLLVVSHFFAAVHGWHTGGQR